LSGNDSLASKARLSIASLGQNFLIMLAKLLETPVQTSLPPETRATRKIGQVQGAAAQRLKGGAMWCCANAAASSTQRIAWFGRLRWLDGCTDSGRSGNLLST